MAVESKFKSESEFRQAVAETLRQLLDQVDEIDSDDLDPRLTDGNLVVTFDSGGTFMLSQQTPTQELWLSAMLKAWHFRCSREGWVERDTGEKMVSVLGSLFTDKLGVPVDFEL